MRNLIMTWLVVGAMMTGMSAHHSYGEYDRDVAVTLDGTVTRVNWANPHVLVVLQTRDGVDYLIEWGAMVMLAKQGIRTAPFKVGDRLVITGALNRNPAKRILTLLREVRRPADGWQWTSGVGVTSTPSTE